MRILYSLLFFLIAFGVSSCGEKDSTLREQSFDEAWLFHRGDIAEGEKQSLRSEERRVGKECRSRWSPYH